MKFNQKGGNPILNVFLGIFVAIAIIILLYIVIVYIVTFVKNRKKKAKNPKSFPPTVYMENTGFDCPDYWIKVRDEKGKSVCRNSFNLKLNEGCKDDATFKKINVEDWKKSKDRGSIENVKERCAWLKKCGGAWQGIDSYC